VTDANSPSGFGFELTFRLKRESDESSPPTWPATVMQALSKYVFQSENILCPGDHVSWHCPLDNSESRIQHMLMAEDPHLGTVNTPFGNVTFIQIVGVCLEELKAAQQWNGAGIIDLMKSIPVAGGPWLITDMRRGETIFEIDPEIQDAVDDGIAVEGSNLSGVSAKCSWNDKALNKEKRGNGETNHSSNSSESESNCDEVSPILDKVNPINNSVSPTNQVSSQTVNSRNSSMSVSHDRTNQSDSRMSYASETGAPESGELIQTKYIERVNIELNLEAGTLLPLALRLVNFRNN